MQFRLFILLSLLCFLPGKANAYETKCENTVEAPIFETKDGMHFVYLFPFVKTPVTYKDGEPFITVYRGIRETISHDEDEFRVFGTHIFTTLSSKVAISYLTRGIRFGTPKSLTVMRMSLPLKLAYVAKRPKTYYGGIAFDAKDEYVPALHNRNYIWFKWKAPIRRRERELVWNTAELGDIRNPKYELSLIEVEVPPWPGTNEYLNHEGWMNAREKARRMIELNQWAPIVQNPD